MNSKPAGYPRFRLFTPNPPDYFFLECSLTKKKPSDPLASMLADWFFSRLYLFKSAWSQKNKRVGPACFFASQRIFYSRLKNQSASIDASGTAGFFPVSEHPKEKIWRVGGKQAEPGVPSGFWIHRTPANFGPTFYAYLIYIVRSRVRVLREYCETRSRTKWSSRRYGPADDMMRDFGSNRIEPKVQCN